jgi:hypothetical protein
MQIAKQKYIFKGILSPNLQKIPLKWTISLLITHILLQLLLNFHHILLYIVYKWELRLL